MGIIVLPPLPELERVPCPSCEAVGYLEAFDDMLAVRCPECFGAQAIDICSGCKQVPTVEGGLEVCGCVFPPAGPGKGAGCASERYLGATSPFGVVVEIEPYLYNPLATVRHADGTESTYRLPFLLAHGLKVMTGAAA